MRFKRKKPIHMYGWPDVVIKSGFLLLPKTIGSETRWLEFARWTMQGTEVEYQDMGNSEHTYKKIKWKKMGWLD